MASIFDPSGRRAKKSLSSRLQNDQALLRFSRSCCERISDAAAARGCHRGHPAPQRRATPCHSIVRAQRTKLRAPAGPERQVSARQQPETPRRGWLGRANGPGSSPSNHALRAPVCPAAIPRRAADCSFTPCSRTPPPTLTPGCSRRTTRSSCGAMARTMQCPLAQTAERFCIRHISSRTKTCR